MPNINYPINPNTGDIYSFNGSNWRFNGSAWVSLLGVGPQGTTGPQGFTGPQGSQGVTGSVPIADIIAYALIFG